jgi:hypothetical protein
MTQVGVRAACGLSSYEEEKKGSNPMLFFLLFFC